MWISHGFTQDDGRFADTRSYDFFERNLDGSHALGRRAGQTLPA